MPRENLTNLKADFTHEQLNQIETTLPLRYAERERLQNGGHRAQPRAAGDAESRRSCGLQVGSSREGAAAIDYRGMGFAIKSFSSEGWTGSESGFAFATAGRVLRGGPFVRSPASGQRRVIWLQAKPQTGGDGDQGGAQGKA